MGRPVRPIAMLAAALLLAHAAQAAAPRRADAHQFSAIGHSFGNGDGETRLRQALDEAAEAGPSFVVVTGIKGAAESCSDKVYTQRRDLLEEARRPVVLVPAASDWSDCKNSAGRSAALERLNRLRELFFADAATLGARKMPLTRLSASPKFRSYAENAHWQVGDVLYATINLPANNNHYRPEAGRNSEYEDRLVANRVWLNRLFTLAKRTKLAGLVLFSEGDVKAMGEPTGLRALIGRGAGSQDGFAEPRRQIATLAQKFGGKVLLVDSAAPANGGEPAIEWMGNLGHLSLGAGAAEVRVTPGTAALFAVKNAADADKEKGAPSKDAPR